MSKKLFKGSAMLNPLPVVLVTSKKGDFVNVFTVAWAGIVCSQPPMLSISIRPERLSYDLIKESKEFVVNIPSGSMAKIVDFCGVKSGRDVDKINYFNLALDQGSNVSVPSISQCPINLECSVKEIIRLGSHDMFLANIKGVKVDESLIDAKGKIHFEKAHLLSYSHGEYYTLPEKTQGKFGFSIQKKKKR